MRIFLQPLVLCSTSLRILYFSTILLQFNFPFRLPIRSLFSSRGINLYVYLNISLFLEMQTFECDFEKK